MFNVFFDKKKDILKHILLCTKGNQIYKEKYIFTKKNMNGIYAVVYQKCQDKLLVVV